MTISSVQMDIYSRALQSLSTDMVSRCMYLKKDAEMVCVKSIYDERVEFDSFEEYYQYYTGNRFRFNFGDRVRIDIFYGPAMVLLRPLPVISSFGTSSYFRVFKEIQEPEAMKHLYLFDYFIFVHEWEALNREEQISTILD